MAEGNIERASRATTLFASAHLLGLRAGQKDVEIKSPCLGQHTARKQVGQGSLLQHIEHSR